MKPIRGTTSSTPGDGILSLRCDARWRPPFFTRGGPASPRNSCGRRGTSRGPSIFSSSRREGTGGGGRRRCGPGQEDGLFPAVLSCGEIGFDRVEDVLRGGSS